MWRLLAVLIFALWFLPAQAQFNNCNAGFCSQGGAVGGGSGGGSGAGSCGQSTAFFARANGLSGTEKTAYDTLICGLVSDGTWALMDAVYIYATNNTTTLTLNLVSSNFPLTLHGAGACTFTADSGYTGDGSTCYEDTGFNPSTVVGNYTRNSATMGVCILTSRSSSNPYWASGADDGNVDAAILPLFNSNGSYYINQTSALNVASAQAQGSYILTRTGASTSGAYKNGSLIGSSGIASTPLANANIYIHALDISGSPGSGSYSADKMGYAFFGSSVSAGQASSIQTRFAAYLSAVGAPSGC